MNPLVSKKEQKIRWLTAAAAALGINLLLLSILPVVNLGTASLPEKPAVMESVGFVRLTPPEPDRTPPRAPEPEPPRPEIPRSPTPATIDLKIEALEQTMRPDLPAVSVQADPAHLPDLAPATVDLAALGVDDVFAADELDRPLLTLSRPPPFYPLQARRTSVEGWVEIEFLVDRQGRVDSITVLDADPPGVFEESVRQAVYGWRFEPGTIMGEPVRARVRTTVRFELEGSE